MRVGVEGDVLRLFESQQPSCSLDPAVCQRSSQVSSHWATLPSFSAQARKKQRPQLSPAWLIQYFAGSQNKISSGLLFLVSSSMTPCLHYFSRGEGGCLVATFQFLSIRMLGILLVATFTVIFKFSDITEVVDDPLFNSWWASRLSSFPVLCVILYLISWTFFFFFFYFSAKTSEIRQWYIG